MGDPCGLVGNGRVHEAMAGVELTALDMEGVSRRYDDILEQIQIEVDLTNQRCALNLELADYRFSVDAQVNDLSLIVNASRATPGMIDRVTEHARTYAALTKCVAGPGGTDCPQGAASAVAYAAVTIPTDLAVAGLDAFDPPSRTRSRSCSVPRPDSRPCISAT